MVDNDTYPFFFQFPIPWNLPILTDKLKRKADPEACSNVCTMRSCFSLPENKGHREKQRTQRPNHKQSFVIRKLNDLTVSGGLTVRCKVYPPRDATGAGAAKRGGGQLGADSISVAGACAGTPG